VIAWSAGWRSHFEGQFGGNQSGHHDPLRIACDSTQKLRENWLGDNHWAPARMAISTRPMRSREMTQLARYGVGGFDDGLFNHWIAPNQSWWMWWNDKVAPVSLVVHCHVPLPATPVLNYTRIILGPNNVPGSDWLTSLVYLGAHPVKSEPLRTPESSPVLGAQSPLHGTITLSKEEDS
jgi:hypothetical protein